MKIDLDDPNLTAYALGELSGAEKTRIEKIVAESPEAQAFVTETRELARLLETDFAADLERAAEKPRNVVPLPSRSSLWWDSQWMSIRVAALFAVCALIAALVISGIKFSGSSAKTTARSSSAANVNHSVTMELPNNTAVEGEPEVVTSNSSGKEEENPFVPAARQPISTFGIKVDTSSYAEVRRLINSGTRPPRDAVQIEAMINYFTYDYPQPETDRPFSINLEAASCPWKPEHRLVRIGLKGAGRNGNLPVAKEVNVEVEFNSTQVDSYRLLGYENRVSRKGSVNNDNTPGEEIEAGHSVTALYEIVANVPSPTTTSSGGMLTVKVRYKRPGNDTFESAERLLLDSRTEFNKASPDFRFAAAVAQFGMILRDSALKGNGTIGDVVEWARAAQAHDESGSRAEFVELVRKADTLLF